MFVCASAHNRGIGTRTFTGDYTTGDFSQWPSVQNKNYNGSGSGYSPTYPVTIVTDGTKGNVARFEVRSGDVAIGDERSQVTSGSNSTAAGGSEGMTKWFQWSTKFDATWPSNHPYWCITNSFHNNSGTGSAAFHWGVGWHTGFWSLIVTEQSSPGVYVNEYAIYETALNQGSWHDIKMQIFFSTSKTGGWVQLWLNGVQQLFMSGQNTAFFSTIVPGSTISYYKESIYRSAEAFTDVLYHTGFRAATTEAGLS